MALDFALAARFVRPRRSGQKIGVCKMEEYIDFFNRYIVAAIQLLLGFFFFVRFLKKKGRLFFELLFVVLGSVVILAVPVGSIVEYLIYAMLLVAMGSFICLSLIHI